MASYSVHMPVLTVEHAFKLMALLISFFSSGQPTHNGLKLILKKHSYFHAPVFSKGYFTVMLFKVQGTRPKSKCSHVILLFTLKKAGDEDFNQFLILMCHLSV